MMKVVYVAKNLLNKKEYIGVDSHWPKRRDDHEYTALSGKRPRFAFHHALLKYGVENFEWQILYESDSISEIKTKEIELISERETLVPSGYNMTPGGEGRSTPHKEETKFLISEALKKNNGMRRPEVAKKVGDAKRGKKINLSEEGKAARARTGKLNGRKAGLLTKGLLWWTDGIKNMRSKESPGKHWSRGYLQTQAAKDKRKGQGSGLLWWTDGIKNTKTKEQPGPNWKRGRT